MPAKPPCLSQCFSDHYQTPCTLPGAVSTVQGAAERVIAVLEEVLRLLGDAALFGEGVGQVIL